MTLQAEIEAELEPTLDLLARLIAQASVEGSDAIARTNELLAEAVRPLRGREAVHTIDGLSNLLIDWGRTDSDHRLLLTGHADVVPADGAWSTPPFELTRTDSTLLGRGVCDMKGGLAAYVGALRVLARIDDLDAIPVSLVVTGDEETGSARGMIPLTEKRTVTGRWAICAEPTDLDVYMGNRGSMSIYIKIRGRGGHAGLAHFYANPVPVAARLATALDELPLHAEDPHFSPPNASLTVTAVNVTAGLPVSVIPEQVLLGVDRRLMPGETPEEALEQIQKTVSEVVTEPFESDVDVRHAWPAYLAEDDDPLIGIAQGVVRSVGRPGKLDADLAADDSTWLGKAGISTILCGPGKPEQAHVVDEQIDVTDVRDAIAIYVGLCLAAKDRDATGSADTAS